MKKIIFICLIIPIFLSPIRIFANDKTVVNSASLSTLKTQDKYLIKLLVIKKILNKYNSPFVDISNSFIVNCVKYNLDCYLLPAITGIESLFGRYIYNNSYNPFGWGGGYVIFKDWGEGIETVAKGLKQNYINKGATDIYKIGKIYAPPSKTWANKVDFYMKEFYNEEVKVREYFLK